MPIMVITTVMVKDFISLQVTMTTREINTIKHLEEAKKAAMITRMKR